MTKTALITGITGQDGSYLAEFLANLGYTVHGIVRRSSIDATGRRAIPLGTILHYGDMTDGIGLREIVGRVKPDEVYNLAAQSHVGVSFSQPSYTVNVDAMGAVNLLEAIRDTGKPTRFYQASSSEMFGKAAESPQDECTPFHPRSPYGCAKVFAYWQTVNYREAYGMHASNGILFNHESPRRGEQFVTRKITRAAARIALGLQDKLQLGNIDAKRDWGFAGDYVEAMWLMLQHDAGDDYVIATGCSHTVREFLAETFGLLRIDWQRYVDLEASCLRPADVETLCGDAGKARRVLGWRPQTEFKALVKMMVDSDMELARQEAKAAA